jgi:hypothetical protein
MRQKNSPPEQTDSPVKRSRQRKTRIIERDDEEEENGAPMNSASPEKVKSDSESTPSKNVDELKRVGSEGEEDASGVGSAKKKRKSSSGDSHEQETIESKLKQYPTTPEKQVCILLYCNSCL